MKIKKYLMALAITIMVTVGVLIYENAFVKFQPILFDDGFGKSGYRKILLNSQLYINLPKVLTYYDETYKTSSHMLYIRRKLANDHDLIWNYTERALDTSWVKEKEKKHFPF